MQHCAGGCIIAAPCSCAAAAARPPPPPPQTHLSRAVECGAPLLPCYHFGNSRLFGWAPKAWEAAARRHRIALGWLTGRWGLPLPLPNRCAAGQLPRRCAAATLRGNLRCVLPPHLLLTQLTTAVPRLLRTPKHPTGCC